MAPSQASSTTTTHPNEKLEDNAKQILDVLGMNLASTAASLNAAVRCAGMPLSVGTNVIEKRAHSSYATMTSEVTAPTSR